MQFNYFKKNWHFYLIVLIIGISITIGLLINLGYLLHLVGKSMILVNIIVALGTLAMAVMTFLSIKQTHDRDWQAKKIEIHEKIGPKIQQLSKEVSTNVKDLKNISIYNIKKDYYYLVVTLPQNIISLIDKIYQVAKEYTDLHIAHSDQFDKIMLAITEKSLGLGIKAAILNIQLKWPKPQQNVSWSNATSLRRLLIENTLPSEFLELNKKPEYTSDTPYLTVNSSEISPDKLDELFYLVEKEIKKNPDIEKLIKKARFLTKKLPELKDAIDNL